ncbi:MAG: carboxypeptidase regulatory-like domain-containing protein [Acidobacteria bacterium]|nr:carboxypeptidase regulatory-like domain-containing protein [Acidobacteriota bacterium]
MIADITGARIAVYDSNLNFKSYIDTSCNGAYGLDAMTNGNVVATCRNSHVVRIYDSTGAVVGGFTSVPNVNSSSADIKVSGAGLLYLAQGFDNIFEVDQSGNKLRGFGNAGTNYFGVALTSASRMWGNRFTSTTETFDISTGSGNNIAPNGSFALDNSQDNMQAMSYSPSTNTVLTTSNGTDVFERNATTGAFVRKFLMSSVPQVGGSGFTAFAGVTRGPSGDVYVTTSQNGSNARVARFNGSTGAFISATSISANIGSPANIIWMGNSVPIVQPTDFIVADINGARLAIYDSNLVFKAYLDTSCNGAFGLDALSNGNIVATCRNTHAVRIYDHTGTIVGGFTSGPNVNSNSGDIKASSTGLLYIAQGFDNIFEVDQSGNKLRGFGNAGTNYTGVALTPASRMWGNRFTNTTEIFGLTTGSGANIAPLSSFVLDNSQDNMQTMSYSGSTNTVLSTSNGTDVFERNANTGAFVRKFLMSSVPQVGGSGFTAFAGVTRGPSGDVYVTTSQNGSNARIIRFNGTTGAFISSTDVSATVSSPANIIWLGAAGPTAAQVSVSGRVLTREGVGLRNATVSMRDAAGNARTAITGAFGYFRFDDVDPGAYVVGVQSRLYAFSARAVIVNDAITDLTFTPVP